MDAPHSSIGLRQADTLTSKHPWLAKIERPADSFGLVLILIVLDYIVVSTVSYGSWGYLIVVLLQGLTLFFALRTSRARRLWVTLAAISVALGTVSAAILAFVPGAVGLRHTIGIISGVLLLVTPIVILNRIIRHTVVSAETLYGAICVYLLLGFSFSALFTALEYFSHSPFFTDVPHATINQFLFFSYTTLTTVGYGNLVPAGSVGQSLAMMEALLGQIYLVIVVARLVSLWGQRVPRNEAKHSAGTDSDKG